MLAFVARRVARLVIVFLLVTLLTASMLSLTGNPALDIAGGTSAKKETIAAIEKQYHFNDPFLTRWWDWFSGVLHGDFGHSYRSQQPVSVMIGQRLPITLELTV